jgi:type II secretory pathway pseudopilin PulG
MEVMVVIVIILILAAILLPAFRSSIERGRLTVDISNLRQLGQAQAMYASDNFQAVEVRTRLIVGAGYGAPDILVSPRDSTREGLANREQAPHVGSPSMALYGQELPWRQSYLTMGDAYGYTWDRFKDRVEGRLNAWAVADFPESKESDGEEWAPCQTNPRHLGLALDGSVKTLSRVDADRKRSPWACYLGAMPHWGPPVGQGSR